MKKVRKHKRLRNTYKRIFALILTVALVMLTPIMAFAADDDDSGTVKALEGLKDFVVNVVKVVGGIICIFGVFQIGTSFPAHDPTQRAMGFLTLAGGIIICFADAILKSIGVM